MLRSPQPFTRHCSFCWNATVAAAALIGIAAAISVRLEPLSAADPPPSALDKPSATTSGDDKTAPAVQQSTDSPEIAKPTPAVAAPKPVTRPITISGRAIHTEGRPIAGAKMYLSSQQVAWERLAETVADAEGRYEFRDVPLPLETESPFSSHISGAFEVFGIAEGYGFGWYPRAWYFPERYPGVADVNWEETDRPTRFYGDEPIELDVTLRPEASLSGRVVDNAGQPIANARVDIRYCDLELDLKDWNSIKAGTQFDSLNERAIVPPDTKLRQTDVDGRFEFTGLPADCRFRIDVRPPGFPSRWIWAVTKSGFSEQVHGQPIYSDGMILKFVPPDAVPLRVVFDDTGAPAEKVRVGASSTQGSSSGVSDRDGNVTLRLTDGKQAVELLPAIGTPYLVTNRELTLPTEDQQSPIELRLRAAAIVEVRVMDETTGEGVSNIDFWSSDSAVAPGEIMHRRNLHHFRSYEVATRICHVERPRTDSEGKLRALFEPGTYRIGVGMNSFPHNAYRNLDAEGTTVELRAGETTTVTFTVRQL